VTVEFSCPGRFVRPRPLAPGVRVTLKPGVAGLAGILVGLSPLSRKLIWYLKTHMSRRAGLRRLVFLTACWGQVVRFNRRGAVAGLAGILVGLSPLSRKLIWYLKTHMSRRAGLRPARCLP